MFRCEFEMSQKGRELSVDPCADTQLHGSLCYIHDFDGGDNFVTSVVISITQSWVVALVLGGHKR